MKYLLSSILVLGMIISFSQNLKSQNNRKITAALIIKNSIKAKGGKKRLKRVKSIKMEIVSNDIGMSAEAYRIPPNKSCDRINFPNDKHIIILNNNKGNMYTNNGSQELSGFMLKNAKEDALIFPELYLDELDYKIKYVGIEEMDGKKLYKLKMIYPDKSEKIRFYDVKTWLPYLTIDQFGIEDYIEEYQEIDGVKFIKSSISKYDGQESRFQFSGIEINLDLDEDIFTIK